MAHGCIDFGFQLGVILGMGIGAVLAMLGCGLALTLYLPRRHPTPETSHD